MQKAQNGLSFAHSYPHKNKRVASALHYAAVPDKAIVSLKQHGGKAAQAVVKVGQNVEKGQLIALAAHEESSSVHAPAPGLVKDIISINQHGEGLTEAIIIETGGRYTNRKISHDYHIKSLSRRDILSNFKSNGLTDIGHQQGHPLHLKLDTAFNPVDFLIINAADDSFYSMLNCQLMESYANELISGIKLALHLTNPTNLLICVNDYNEDMGLKLQEVFKEEGLPCTLELSSDLLYPTANEVILAENATGKQLFYGQNLMDIGCISLNPNTLIAMHQALFHDQPHIQHAITLAGDALAEGKNLMAYIGTTIRFLIEECGGFKKPVKRIVAGNPMEGFNIVDLDSPITKQISLILALTATEVRQSSEKPCSQCQHCVSHCPRHLWPHELYKALLNNRPDLAWKMNLSQCIGCGNCAYVCPSRINLSQAFKLAQQQSDFKENSHEKIR